MVKSLYIIKAYLLLAAMAMGLLMPLHHALDHGNEHHETEVHQCIHSLCLDDVHREQLEHCANDTHLYCEVCDLFAPMLPSVEGPQSSVPWNYGVRVGPAFLQPTYEAAPTPILGRGPPLC